MEVCRDLKSVEKCCVSCTGDLVLLFQMPVKEQRATVDSIVGERKQLAFVLSTFKVVTAG